MWEWVRNGLGKLTPTYGKCGGSMADCSTRPPQDDMDLAFAEHDQNCFQASLLGSNFRIEEGKAQADTILHAELEEIDPSHLSLYGKLYRLACLVIFK